MKKLLLTTLLFGLCSTVFAINEIKYSPTENELKAIRLFLQDDIRIFLKGGETMAGDIYDKHELVQGEIETADSLLNEYEKNEARADKKFKGKQLFVSGIVDGVKSGMGDEPYIVFKNKKYTFNAVQARFIKSEEDKIIELDKGSKVNLVCKGAGEIAGTPMLNDCKFTSTLENELVDYYYGDIEKLTNDPTKEQIVNMPIFIRTIAFIMNSYGKATNNFEKCNGDKFNFKCVNNLILDKKIKKEADKIQDENKELSEYLQLSEPSK